MKVQKRIQEQNVNFNVYLCSFLCILSYCQQFCVHVAIVELQVNSFVERAYNKVATSLIEIVKCHLSGGNEESQEIYNSLLLVFMKVFQPNASSLKVYSLSCKPKWSVSDLLTGFTMYTHTHTHTHTHTYTH
jgi:hypothetical protein